MDNPITAASIAGALTVAQAARIQRVQDGFATARKGKGLFGTVDLAPVEFRPPRQGLSNTETVADPASLAEMLQGFTPEDASRLRQTMAGWRADDLSPLHCNALQK